MENSSQCIRMGDRSGSAAGYNYSLSQNDVLVVLKGHQGLETIKCSTKWCTSTLPSCMLSDSCIYSALILTILIT